MTISRFLKATALFMLLASLPFIRPTWADTSQTGAWVIAAPAPAPRTEVGAAAIGSNIYVVGGFNKPNLQNALKYAISNDLEIYDTAADFWSVAAPLPEGRHHAGIVSLNGMLYVIGGFAQSMLSVWHAVATVYQYNPATQEWRELAPMPTARGALGVAVHQDRIYAVGGYDGKHNSDAVEVFDPQSNTWSSGAPMPTPRDHLAVVAADDRLYAIGGRPELDYHRNMATVEEYDPQTQAWRARANLPTPRSGMAAGAIGEWIYVVGGESKQGTFSTNEAYHPATNQWRSMAPMPTARHGSGAAVFGGRVYVINGGPKPGGSFSQVNEVFTPPAIKP